MKKILVPTDFSEQAENALKVAAQLAKKYGSEIYLLHMLELPMQDFDVMNTPNVLPEAMFFMKLAQQRFETLLAQDYLKEIKVYDISGKLVHSASKVSSTIRYELPLQANKAGYVVHITSDQGEQVVTKILR